MVRSERIENFVIGGLTSVFILLTIGLAINWLTGHEAQRSLILMILGGLIEGYGVGDLVDGER